MNETDLFKPVKDHYLIRNCEVFSEVMVGKSGGRRADVVIKDNNLITVIELKTSLSLDLLDQCYEWMSHAHYVYACIPAPKNYRGNKLIQMNSYTRRLLKNDGIGLLIVRFLSESEKAFYKQYPDLYHEAEVIEIFKPRLNRKIATNWTQYITEKHKSTLPGGTKGGGYITPYKEMMEDIQSRLKYHKTGLSYNTLVDDFGYHYANPKQSLMNALLKYESDWCEIYHKDGVAYCRIREKSNCVL